MLQRISLPKTWVTYFPFMCGTVGCWLWHLAFHCFIWLVIHCIIRQCYRQTKWKFLKFTVTKRLWTNCCIKNGTWFSTKLLRNCLPKQSSNRIYQLGSYSCCLQPDNTSRATQLIADRYNLFLDTMSHVMVWDMTRQQRMQCVKMLCATASQRQLASLASSNCICNHIHNTTDVA